MPKPDPLTDLYDLFRAIETREEARDLLDDLLTPGELASLTERWQEVQLLAAGITQRDVAKQLGVSISKVTRGSRMLQHGSGGFHHFLKKLGKPVRAPAR